MTNSSGKDCMDVALQSSRRTSVSENDVGNAENVQYRKLVKQHLRRYTAVSNVDKRTACDSDRRATLARPKSTWSFCIQH
eukprot:scaffold421228_cov49-Attheya_sp.AAC.5